jgi:hypothetical protein
MLELTLLAIAVGIFFLIKELRKSRSISGPDSAPDEVVKPHIPLYRKKSSIMNKSEMAFFFELEKQLPEGYHIFPNMRLADILEAVDGPGFYARNNKLMPRHIDFLICDRYFKPCVAIEINGSSHRRADRMEIDEQKRETFKDANLPLEFVDVGTSFEQSVARIKTHLPVK